MFYLNLHHSTALQVLSYAIISLSLFCILGEVLRSQMFSNLHIRFSIIVSRFILLLALDVRCRNFQEFCLILLSMKQFRIRLFGQNLFNNHCLDKEDIKLYFLASERERLASTLYIYSKMDRVAKYNCTLAQEYFQQKLICISHFMQVGLRYIYCSSEIYVYQIFGDENACK